MKKRKNKYSGNGMKQDLALIGRGFKLLWEIHPAHMIWFTVYTVFKQILPYFALYMSALLVDEIVAGAPVPRLITLAAVTVGGGIAGIAGMLLRSCGGIENRDPSCGNC